MRKIFHTLRRIWRLERPDARVSIRVRQPLALAAFIVALAWYLAAPSPTTVMSAVAVAGMILFGFLWVRALGKNLSAARHLRYAALQVGEELEEEIRLSNGSRLPAVWAEFEDHSNIPGYTLSNVRGVDGHDEAHWRATTLCARRGIYALGPWEIISGDPFGIFSLRLEHPSHEELLVYPPLAPLPPHWLPKGRAVGEQRLLRQALPVETINLLTTRPFAPGDPLRHIHWRTTARREQTYVKVFEPESYSSVWLIPNLDAAAHFGGGRAGEDDSLEKLVILAASLAAELLGERRAVGLFAGETVIPPQAGSPHLWAILRGLAGLPSLEGLQAAPRQPFERVLRRAARVVSRRSLVIALTPSDPALKEEEGALDWINLLSGGAGETPRVSAANAVAVLLVPDAPAGEGVGACLEGLAARNIPARAIRAGDICPPTTSSGSGSYGALQRWEFITLGTGRAYARHKPREAPNPLPGGRR